MALTRSQPPWTPPRAPEDGVQLPPLNIYNSLTRSKNPFIPLDPKGKKVKWYACGPTVYDVSHLGHARNYMSTDIIRRILKDYFEFDTYFVMNITDVDDKIILRARQRYFLSRFKAEHAIIDANVLSTTLTAFNAYIKKNLPLVPEPTTPETFSAASIKEYQAIKDGNSLAGDGTPPGDKEAKIKMHLRTSESAANVISQAKSNQNSVKAETFYSATEDVLLPYLDSLYGNSIDPYNHTIFTDLTKKYEKLFFEDMRSLNVLDPNKLTRVTEFGPQIVKFVEKIVAKGFAYPTSDGSVYFDISNFEKAGNPYARLEPWNRGDTDLQADGEGALSKKTTEKKSDSDFALWKGSKAGEPAWKSPWGDGRPGWHIECSVMASEALGKQMDIHSGGIDLAFPHHDNELAQSEAYWSGDQGCAGHSHEWVKYFLHMGHLSIQGHKMSKSLKNFTSIRQALAPAEDGTPAWTPRGLRVVFLLGGWKEGVEITEDLVKQGKVWEEKVTNFFLKAVDLRRNSSTSTGNTSIQSSSKENLVKILDKAKADMHLALCDSFNTPLAMETISSLITQVNSIRHSDLSPVITIEIAQWITKIVTIFGLNGAKTVNEISTIGWDGVEIPTAAQPYIYPLSQLRDDVRKIARSKDYSPSSSPQQIQARISESTKAKAEHPQDNAYAATLTTFHTDVLSAAEKPNVEAKIFLALCDTLRDTHLWNLDIYLEDRDAPLGALVRPLDLSLKQARLEKEQREAERLEAKAKREREEAEKQREKDEKAKVSPKDMFRTSEYTAWDEEGLPTKDKDGNDVTKSKRKGLLKEWKRQEKMHEDWLKRNGGT